MKVLKTIELGKNESGDYIVAEIVDDVTPEERKEFEDYELVEEYDLTRDEKQKLGNLVKRYLKSYSKYKDKMSLEKWLIIMFKEDMPNISYRQRMKIAKKIIADIKKTYELKKKVKRDMDMGFSYTESFKKNIMRDKNFQNLPAENLKLAELDNALTKQGIEQLYTLAEADNDFVIKHFTDSSTPKNIIEFLGKEIGNQRVNRYFKNIDEVIEVANKKMWNATHTMAGNPNMNPNLDGFIAEQAHVNSFNIDAAVKEIKNVEAQVLTSEGAYGKNSVDIVIKEIGSGKTRIIKKYQAKFCKDATATANAFYDNNGYKYHFQGKLTPEGQAQQIKNGIDRIEACGAQSKSLTKEDVKNMQTQVQRGDMNSLNANFSDIETSLLLERIGRKVVRNTVMAGTSAMLFNVGKNIVSGEKIDSDEIIEQSIKTGQTIGISTAVAGALHIAARKGIVKGILTDTNVISSIAFSITDCLGTLYKMGSGECSLDEGMGDIGASLTTGYLTTQTFVAGNLAFATVATMVAAPAAAVTIGSVIAATTLSLAGSGVINCISSGVKTVVSEVVSTAKNIVSKGIDFVKDMASAACSTIKSAGRTIRSKISSAHRLASRLFRW